jgi:hypothetical protein
MYKFILPVEDGFPVIGKFEVWLDQRCLEIAAAQARKLDAAILKTFCEKFPHDE